MNYSEPNSISAPKHKRLFVVLFCGIILTSPIFAFGKSWNRNKVSSCKTLRSMARVYMAFGDYEKAQPIAERALNVAKTKSLSDNEFALCYTDLAWLYLGQGRLGDAEEMCKRGLLLQKKALYENHPHIAQTLRTLGSIHREQGRYEQARMDLSQAISIMLDSHSENDKALTPFNVEIARIASDEDNYEEADRLFQQAMVNILSSYGPDHLYTAGVQTDIAKLYIKQNRFTEAETLINHSIRIQEKTYGSEHHIVTQSWLAKAKICRAKADFTTSDRFIEKAIAAVQKSGNKTLLAKTQRTAQQIRHSSNNVQVAKVSS